MRHIIRSSEGLTLLEVLISATILAVFLVALATMFPTSLKGMEEAGATTRALSLAQEMLEEIHGTAPFPDILLYNGQSTAQATFNTGAALVDANLGAWKQAIEQVPGSGIPQGVGRLTVTVAGATPARLATITVQVQWPNDRGIAAVLTTQIAES
ncbi:MAG: prepilin-type N-terminal cleavage/methylation domain-containing protein [Candidatus Methylomirabilales bacterium]